MLFRLEGCFLLLLDGKRYSIDVCQPQNRYNFTLEKDVKELPSLSAIETMQAWYLASAGRNFSEIFLPSFANSEPHCPGLRLDGRANRKMYHALGNYQIVFWMRSKSAMDAFCSDENLRTKRNPNSLAWRKISMV
mmetsp:Transcript_14319/g.29686  ORF Transcript_14319/g.29686 Transcript_14319/m.29686 type:complete len:135 (+) Transcript_14319:120-524(+)